jgi:hypothetical protein
LLVERHFSSRIAGQAQRTIGLRQQEMDLLVIGVFASHSEKVIKCLAWLTGFDEGLPQSLSGTGKRISRG